MKSWLLTKFVISTIGISCLIGKRWLILEILSFVNYQDAKDSKHFEALQNFTSRLISNINLLQILISLNQIQLNLVLFHLLILQCRVVEFIREGVTKLFQKDEKAVQWILVYFTKKSICLKLWSIFRYDWVMNFSKKNLSTFWNLQIHEP